MEMSVTGVAGHRSSPEAFRCTHQPTTFLATGLMRFLVRSVDALSRVAAGGTALDPEVVTQLLGASRRNDGLGP
jgi:hypothetical protein